MKTESNQDYEKQPVETITPTPEKSQNPLAKRPERGTQFGQIPYNVGAYNRVKPQQEQP